MAKTKGLRPGTDLYDLLEVNPRASQEVIDAAYKTLMRIHHPSLKGGKTDIARRLEEAYAVLCDPAKRADYDRAREDLEGKQIGEFRVLEFIAEGGFGKTYKGEHVLVGEPVCIKHCSRISPQDTEILINEAKAAWDLRHYAVPTMRNLLKLDDGSMALVMSFIPGATLAKFVEKHGRLKAEHVAWIAERVLNALMYMHWHGVVHGDIKPQNLLIQSREHTAVLVDYGLSMIKPKADSESKGFTDLFAPPEQLNGSPLLPQSDFYSLGMMMIYALSGGLDHVRRKEVPEDVPEPLCEFIRRLTMRDVLKRPHWENENLWESIQKVRQEAFGRSRSNMEQLPEV